MRIFVTREVVRYSAFSDIYEYQARLENHPEIQGIGNSIESAIGNLVRTNPARFNTDVILHPKLASQLDAQQRY